MGTLLNGIKEIFATSQSTATHLPVCASDGTPQGRISVGDLASVLGVLSDIAKGVFSVRIYNGDANDLDSGCVYITSDAISRHVPVVYSFLITLGPKNGDQAQFCIAAGTPRCYFRASNSGTWKDWQEITGNLPTFYKNYATFQGLVSAITGNINWNGTTHLVAETDNSVDVSTLECGVYSVTHGRKIIGHPSEISTQVTLIIRAAYSGDDKSTLLVPVEAGTGVGIWAKYKDSVASFAKVV